MCQPQGGIGGAKWFDRCSQRPQYRCIMSRFLCEAFIDDNGRYVGIDDGGAKGILEASDEHRLVDEAVQRTTKPAPFGAKISSAGTAECGSRAPLWPTRRPRPRLPSRRPSGAVRDSHEILR